MEQNQHNIDAILKKLAEHGYDGLTREEKQLLFKRQMRDAKGTRYDTPLELLLTMIITLELVLHGLQRIVLAAELPIYVKFSRFKENTEFSRLFNTLLGISAIGFFGLLFILTLIDYRAGRVYFTGYSPGKRSSLKYWGKMIIIFLFLVWMGLLIAGCWKAFIGKIA